MCKGRLYTLSEDSPIDVLSKYVDFLFLDYYLIMDIIDNAVLEARRKRHERYFQQVQKDRTQAPKVDASTLAEDLIKVASDLGITLTNVGGIVEKLMAMGWEKTSLLEQRNWNG